MTPELGGPINTTFLEQYYNVTVAAALASSPTAHVIVDLVSESVLSSSSDFSENELQHNYARWNGEIISQGGPTNEQYGSIWYQLGQVYGNNDRLLL